jgi:hypothetical protein
MKEKDKRGKNTTWQVYRLLILCVCWLIN